MTTTLTRETEMPAKKKTAPPKSDTHTTPRRLITMHDDLYGPLQELARLRHSNASALIRDAVREMIAEARAEGELPKRRRSA